MCKEYLHAHRGYNSSEVLQLDFLNPYETSLKAKDLVRTIDDNPPVANFDYLRHLELSRVNPDTNIPEFCTINMSVFCQRRQFNHTARESRAPRITVSAGINV